MAIACHVVVVGLKTCNSLGQPIDKNSATISMMLHTQGEHRVMEDATVPNSDGFPAPTTYIQLEAADGFILGYMDQSRIVTYSAADINAAT